MVELDELWKLQKKLDALKHGEIVMGGEIVPKNWTHDGNLFKPPDWSYDGEGYLPKNAMRLPGGKIIIIKDD